MVMDGAGLEKVYGMVSKVWGRDGSETLRIGGCSDGSLRQQNPVLLAFSIKEGVFLAKSDPCGLTKDPT
jgi:hypothetical protein